MSDEILEDCKKTTLEGIECSMEASDETWTSECVNEFKHMIDGDSVEKEAFEEHVTDLHDKMSHEMLARLRGDEEVSNHTCNIIIHLNI